MKTSRLVTAVLLFAAGTNASRANLGDTEAQCMARYGSESDTKDSLGYDVVGDRAATFHVATPAGPLILKVIFLRGRDCHEEISNADASRGLPEDRMKAILDAESSSFKWHKQKSMYRTDNSGTTAGVENWGRSDGANAKFWLSGKAAAQSFSGQMEISTKEYTSAQDFYNKQDGTN